MPRAARPKAPAAARVAAEAVRCCVAGRSNIAAPSPRRRHRHRRRPLHLFHRRSHGVSVTCLSGLGEKIREIRGEAREYATGRTRLFDDAIKRSSLRRFARCASFSTSTHTKKNSTTSDEFHSDVLRFDTSSLNWARGFDPCPSPRSHHVAFHVEEEQGPGSGGSIWVAGGHDASDVLSSVLAFDLEALRWSEVTPRLRGRPELLARMAAAATSATAPHEKGCVVIHGGVAPAASAASGAGGTGGGTGTPAAAANAANAARAAAADNWLSDLVLVDPKRMLVERIEVSGAKGGGSIGTSRGGFGDTAGETAAHGGNENPSPSLSPHLPPPRAYHSLTSVSGRLVVFGGRLPDNSLAKGEDLVSRVCLFFVSFFL